MRTETEKRNHELGKNEKTSPTHRSHTHTHKIENISMLPVNVRMRRKAESLLNIVV